MVRQVAVSEDNLVTIPGVRAVRDWLDRTPTNSPIDRLNARFIQVLMIAFGLSIVLGRLYYMLAEPSVALPASWTLDAITDLATDIAVALAAWVGVVVVRRGHFNTGIQIFLGICLMSLAANYATTGYHHAPPDPTATLLLAIGGIVLGRRTLWAVFAAIMSAFVLGQLADALWLPGPKLSFGDAFHTLPMLAVAYLLISFAIDFTTRALRTMLAEALQHTRVLARTNELLKTEMEERERTQHQLIHSQKLDAIGRAASGVAHDFDNVLNVVLGYASQREQLADRGTPALLNALEGIELAALRALAISRKLLNFSRQDASHTQVFDAAATLAELEPMLRQLLGPYIQLDIVLRAHDMPIRLDRGQFELMVLNVAANARDAMPDGGRFSLILEHDLERDPERDTAAPTLLLSLVDTGMGMSAEVQAKVFEPFYTTKPLGRGTGLGLAVVASMIDAAGGAIDVTSTPGKGTRFRIRVPLYIASRQQPAVSV